MNASSIFTGDDGALVEEACEHSGKCAIDQRAFKGIAVRSFGRAALVAPIVADSIHSMLNASAKGAAENCKDNGDSVACGLSWSSSIDDTGDQATAAGGNLGEVLNALSAVQALLWPTTDFANGTGSVSPNATTSERPSGTTSGVENTGAGATLAVSFRIVLAFAFAATLSC